MKYAWPRLLALLAMALCALGSLAGLASVSGGSGDLPTNSVIYAYDAYLTPTTPSVNVAVATPTLEIEDPGFLKQSVLLAGSFSATEDGGGLLSRLINDETGSFTPPIKTPWGWSGSASYRAAVSEIGGGGTLEAVGGTIPSQAQAEQLIEDAGGTVQRIEEGHLPPNPHQYPHINYTTASGLRGTVQIAP